MFGERDSSKEAESVIKTNFIKNDMKKFLESMSKLFAKFYNWLPQKIKIAVYVATSTIVAGLITLLIKYLTEMDITSEALGIIVSAFIPVLTIIVNIIQKSIVDYGTKLLALADDTTTIDMLKEKVVDTKSLIKSSEK